MASLYITEFADIGAIKGPTPIADTPANTVQKVTIGGSSTQSSAFASNTRLVRLHTDAICSVLFGSNPTATASHSRMSADTTEYFAVTPGHKVAVITNT